MGKETGGGGGGTKLWSGLGYNQGGGGGLEGEHLLCYISMQMNEMIITGKGDQREEAYKN